MVTPIMIEDAVAADAASKNPGTISLSLNANVSASLSSLDNFHI